MEEREKLWIYIAKIDREIFIGLQSRLQAFIQRNARANARHRYVDRLTKKQRDAINFIRMLDDEGFIDNVGGKTNATRRTGPARQVTVYILDC